MGKEKQFRAIARKLRTYLAIYRGDKEAREMAEWCDKEADTLTRRRAECSHCGLS